MTVLDRIVGCRLDAEEGTLMAEEGFVSVVDLLQRTIYNDKFIFNLNLTERARDPDLSLTERQIQKLDWLVGNV